MALVSLALNPASAAGHGGFHGGSGGGGQHAFSGGHAGYAPGPHFGAMTHFAAPHVGGAHYGAAGPGAVHAGGPHYAQPYYHSYARAYNGGYGHRPGWGGGYWHGRFWPGAYYRAGLPWFLPVLPIGYLTLWWGGMPYYYWDDSYYLWSPERRGYVVTDPPPAADGTSDGDGAVAASGAAPELYVYPRQGQSESQTASDRFECHQWAVGQSGFDPSRSSNPAGTAESSYQRAITACLDARGYSAR